MTLPVSTRLNWSVSRRIESHMCICSDFFAIFGVPSRNVSLFLLDKFQGMLLERSSLNTEAKVDQSYRSKFQLLVFPVQANSL